MKSKHALATFTLAAFLAAPSFTITLQAAEETSIAVGKGIPIIQFETNSVDFGKTSTIDTLSGVFKFKNVGDGVLKVQRPEPSCDCTESQVKPDTLAPGESGEIVYVIKLDHPLDGQRFITVRSNDPKTPVLKLTMKINHTPLYELSPKVLVMAVPAGKKEAQATFTVSRSDDKPLEIDRVTGSDTSITAAFESSSQPDESSARIVVTVHRSSDSPSLIKGAVQMWNRNQASRPVQTISVVGQILGEVATYPSQIYWVIPDLGTNKSSYSAQSLTKTIELTSVLGRDVELKNPTTGIKGLNMQIVPKKPGKQFDLVLKFDEVPTEFSNGKVTVQTSLASLPKIEIPVTVAVPTAN
jgi:uncharacterized protein DUF1573